jgi:hypothetical protein
MTYNQLIEKIRMRGFEFLHGTRYYEVGVVYDALHDALRHIFFTTKQHEGTASLSLVAGTRDYTISSAIDADCDSIIYIQIDTGSIEPRTLRELQDEIHLDVDDEDDLTQGTAEFYRIFNGVLRVYPTPGTSMTATVYFTKKDAPDFYTTAIGATTMSLKDEFIEPVIYEALAILAESLGDFKRAMAYREVGKFKLEETRDAQTVHAVETIQYQEPL